MPFYSFQNIAPVIHESAYVHPDATVIGEVTIGATVFIGAQAVIRGDFGKIIINDGANIQEACVVHSFPGKAVLIEKNAHIGHGAIIHGATIGENALIGMNAVIMDDAIIGTNCIIGALSFVKEGLIIGDGKLAFGNPAREIRTLTADEIEWKTKGTTLYQDLALAKEIKPCDPLAWGEMQSPRAQTYAHKPKNDKIKSARD